MERGNICMDILMSQACKSRKGMGGEKGCSPHVCLDLDLQLSVETTTHVFDWKNASAAPMCIGLVLEEENCSFQEKGEKIAQTTSQMMLNFGSEVIESIKEPKTFLIVTENVHKFLWTLTYTSVV